MTIVATKKQWNDFTEANERPSYETGQQDHQERRRREHSEGEHGPRRLPFAGPHPARNFPAVFTAT